jgi:phage repressor protein C with HTH and peptisase S24 domain
MERETDKAGRRDMTATALRLDEMARECGLARATDFAPIAGRGTDAVRKWTSRDSIPKEAAEAIAARFGYTVDYVLTGRDPKHREKSDKISDASPPVPPGAFVPRPVEVAAPGTMPVDVPVYGTAVAGQDADFELNGEVTDRVRRPLGLIHAREAFGLYVSGTSMSPRYEEGDLIFVHPGRPPSPGCMVVVELADPDGFGRHRALLKRYLGRTATRLLLWQMNPQTEIEIDLDRVRQIFRVLTTAELMGV